MIRNLYRSAIAALLALALFASPASATNVCTVGITTAVTGSIQSAVTGFGAPQGLTIQGVFTYVASAATSADAYVQTSIDGGVTWFDLADFHYTTASLTNYQNITGLTAVIASATLTSGTLTANTAINGWLGDRFRCYVTTVGTYGAGTQLTINVYAR